MWSASSVLVTCLLKDRSSSRRFFRVSSVICSSCYSKSTFSFLYSLGDALLDFATAELISFRWPTLAFLDRLIVRKFLFSSYFLTNSLCFSISSFAFFSSLSFLCLSSSSFTFYSSSFNFLSRSALPLSILFCSAFILWASFLAFYVASVSLMSNFYF